VGAAVREEDGEAFADKMRRLAAQLESQLTQNEILTARIRDNFRALGFPLKEGT